MTVSLEDETCTRMSRFLPNALERAISSYKMISILYPVDRETKQAKPTEFKKQQDACKMALAHVEFIMKLTQRTVDMYNKKPNTEDDAQTQKELEAMLQSARQEICEIDQI